MSSRIKHKQKVVMTKSFRENEKGVAHVLLAVVVVVVIAAIALVAWKVSSNSSIPSTGINKGTQDKCMTAVNDKQFCKFAGVFANVTNYKATLAVSDQSGASAGIELAYDSNNSSMIVKENGQEKANLVVYSGVTYSKDYSDGKWFKYTAGDKNAPQITDLKKEFLKNDFKNDKGQKITFKNLGTEKCDNLNCYKYQSIDPATPTQTAYIWFDTKSYLLRKATIYDSKDKTNTVLTLTYESVSISLPSPSKDAPVASPSQ